MYMSLGCICGSLFASPWWLTWIAVHKPLVADGVVYTPSVACVDRRLQAFSGRWGHLQAFGGIRGIVVHKPLVADGVIYKPLVAYMDPRVQGF